MVSLLHDSWNWIFRPQHAHVGTQSGLTLNRLPLGGQALTEVPHQSTLRTKTRFNAFHHHHKMRDIYTKTLRIDKAVAAIQRGEFVYYANVTKHYKYSRNAVS